MVSSVYKIYQILIYIDPIHPIYSNNYLLDHIILSRFALLSLYSITSNYDTLSNCHANILYLYLSDIEYSNDSAQIMYTHSPLYNSINLLPSLNSSNVYLFSSYYFEYNSISQNL
jgi:hypothetical protein